jgi:chromosome segregation ATPase
LKLKNTDDKITGLETECENYKNQTASKEKESELIKNELESLKNEFDTKIAEKEKELESMKREFDIKIIEKEKEMESMKSELIEISNIKKENEQKVKDNEGIILDLKTRNQTLETQMLKAINLPKLLKEVREILVSKGFISEMEFENIMKK